MSRALPEVSSEEENLRPIELVLTPIDRQDEVPHIVITFTKSKLPWGWLGNMAGGFPLRYDGQDYQSSEALFQCLGFPQSPEAQEAIRSATSPLWAKKRAAKRRDELKVSIRDAADLDRMRLCLVLKLKCNPQLIAPLLETHPKLIVEDCTARPQDREIDGTSPAVPFWGAVIDGKNLKGDNALGKLWMEIREELLTKGKASAVSPKGDKVEVSKDASIDGKVAFGAPLSIGAPDLTVAEERALERYEQEILAGRKAVEDGFATMVRAMYAIYRKRLYRKNGRTFAEYFRSKWNFERAHSYRLIQCGRLLEEMKSAALRHFTSQAHFRPLLATGDDNVITSAIERLDSWMGKDRSLAVTPSVVDAAVSLVKSVNPPKSSAKDVTISSAKVLQLLAAATQRKPKTVADAEKAFANLRQDIQSLARKSKTGISWTDATWNPLQGCKKISAGCQYCYAATLLATRLKGRYPGIAEKRARTPKGSSPFDFTGNVRLLVDALSEPLGVKTPRRYFVNSLSDLFYEEVPTWFIDDVFDVMEKATWHQFQVLTKRPKRMAEYTQVRYGRRQPPSHIWLGATVENQQEHDRRMSHLKNVMAAVRWLSCEPLLGPVKLKLAGIHWVIAGGESGSTRKMERQWVVGIRDQCRKAGVPFFFKQWGNFGEDGKANRHLAKDGHETLDGNIHHSYPNGAADKN